MAKGRSTRFSMQQLHVTQQYQRPFSASTLLHTFSVSGRERNTTLDASEGVELFVFLVLVENAFVHNRVVGVPETLTELGGLLTDDS